MIFLHFVSILGGQRDECTALSGIRGFGFFGSGLNGFIFVLIMKCPFACCPVVHFFRSVRLINLSMAFSLGFKYSQLV
jgi:hypothetical protein